MNENKPDVDVTFGKDEKICSQKIIDKLFREGKSFVAYPLRVVYFTSPKVVVAEQHPNILISVSKRKFKRANKRNRVKRLIREAYRLNKSSLVDFCRQEELSIQLAFLYLKDELPSYQEIEKAVKKTIAVLIAKERTNEETAD